MNDPTESWGEKIEILKERADDIVNFVKTLATMKEKLQNKKQMVKGIIEQKIEDNIKELNKWKELLFMIVDESMDEKTQQIDKQEGILMDTHKQFMEVLNKKTKEDDDESDGEEPTLEDLLSLPVNLTPEGLSTSEANERDSSIKNDFQVLLSEPKKSLRRTFAYVGGIIRGYLRRGKSDVNWIKIMRKNLKEENLKKVQLLEIHILAQNCRLLIIDFNFMKMLITPGIQWHPFLKTEIMNRYMLNLLHNYQKCTKEIHQMLNFIYHNYVIFC